jgi:selT/selW/selH-like putative selenoprotein
LLKGFADYLSAVELIPGDGGAFEVSINEELAFSKKLVGRYPEIQELNEAIASRLP